MFARLLPALDPGEDPPPVAPERRLAARALILVALVLLAAIPFVPPPEPGLLAAPATHGPLLAGLAATAAIALARGLWGAAHVAVLATLYLAAHLLPVVGAAWPLPLPVILGAHLLWTAALPAARRSATFLRRGAVDRPTWGLIVAFSAAATIALVTWRATTDADLARYRDFVPPGLPAWLLFAGVLPYAALNAAFEEYVWRGVLWEGIQGAFDRRIALALTALSFGLAHYRGFPSGAVGVGLAVVYGLMMGVVRARSGGLLGPFLAHVVADVVIYALVVAMILG